MKVTTALKKELAQWLDTYWTTYLNGDIATWATFIRDDYRNIGGTKEEIWNSKQEIIDYTNSIMDQMIGTVDIRNRQVDVIPYGEYMMVNEFIDLYVKIEGEWILYGPFRMSSLLEKTDTGWIALHQHGSYPDMKALEGEAFSMDAIKAENIKLQEAVKSRTIELEIEAALERVRAAAMGMKKPEDMLDVCRVISGQLLQFGVKGIRNVQTAIINENIGQYICYQYFPTYHQTTIEDTEYHKSPVEHEMVNRMLACCDGHFIGSLNGEELDAFKQHRKTENHFPDPLLDEASELGYCFLSIGEGGLGLSLYQPMNDEVLTLFKRFHQVFSLAYQRFRDIQKAESQAREAQIEAALERVRSRSMAMHHSDELLEAGEIIFVEMQKLGIESLTAGFVLMDKEEQNGLNYTPHPATKKIMPVPVIIPHNETIHMQQVVENWKNGKPFFIIEMDEEETIKHQTFIANRSTNFPLTAAELIAISPARLVLHNFFFKEGYVLIVGGKKLSVEQTEIMLRFAKVFQQTYTRFLDLQKAEAQAREAQIEASLEKVRAHTMGMQSSNDLSNVASVMFNQMKNLGGELFSFAIVLCDKQKDMVEQWHNIGNEGMLPPFFVPVDLDYIHRYRYDQWKAGAELFSIEIPSSYIVRHFELMFELPSVQAAMADATTQGVQVEIPAWEMDYGASFRHGYLLISSFKLFEEDYIFPRFATVFDQAYTRFLDLQKAEAQAREAQIEAALERVRSRTLAMHKSDELADAAFVLFQQLALLGVVHERINIGIVHEEKNSIDFWVTEQGGNQINTRFTGSIHEPTTISKLFAGWKHSEKSIMVDLLDDNLTQWLKYLNEIGIPFDPAFSHSRRVQTAAFFSKGMLVVTTPAPIPQEHVHLLERFAAVFNLTYTRFNDLQVAEAHARQAEQDLIAIKDAKQKAENALIELQATQKQLIQSEKMASLGELTAGIAHEIQNPLNFVNNFSEVSNELIEEMKEEFKKGELDEGLAIADDIKQNLEKINHHGKRADAIVKGMLQHSRTSSGQKEPTDINELCEEYLRLAYHGLKAKDNAFEASFYFEPDDSLTKVNVVPQDIGRVLLNLINNAFQAVHFVETQCIASLQNAYTPTVTVTTKNLGDHIQVSVKDNGSGIHDSIKDKIFQPFFTTKPTGQGTGLGLSLSYDIVKAHGGELKVETEPILARSEGEGKGSEFIILLPV